MINNKKTLNTMIILLMVSLGFFIVSGFLFSGSLNNTATLSKEILSPPETLYEYNIASIEPFKYRILFYSLIKFTYFILSDADNNQNFYAIYIFWSGIFYVSAVLSFFTLLLTLKFNHRYAIIGTILFLISPAVIFAFSLPVHTREDMMGYTILNMGLIFILKNNNRGILACSILGVLCRETLLLIPLIFLLYGKANIRFRSGVFFLSVLTFLAIRFILKSEGYDPIGLGLLYNLENLEETIGFLFLAFSFMWPIFLFDLYYINLQVRKKLDNNPIGLLRKSSAIVFALVLTSTFIGGRMNEVRLLFILFPWVISIFLYYLQSGLTPLIKNEGTKRYKVYGILVGIACLSLYIVVYYNIHFFLGGLHDVPYIQWIAITCIYLYIFLLLIPLYIAFMRELRLSTNKNISNY